MNQLSELLADVLKTFYPNVVFDTEGLTYLLLPCLGVVLISLIISLFMRLYRGARRFAYLPVTIAVIVMIALTAFFPSSLMQAGEYAANQIQQTFSAQE